MEPIKTSVFQKPDLSVFDNKEMESRARREEALQLINAVSERKDSLWMIMGKGLREIGERYAAVPELIGIGIEKLGIKPVAQQLVQPEIEPVIPKVISPEVKPPDMGILGYFDAAKLGVSITDYFANQQMVRPFTTPEKRREEAERFYGIGKPVPTEGFLFGFGKGMEHTIPVVAMFADSDYEPKNIVEYSGYALGSALMFIGAAGGVNTVLRATGLFGPAGVSFLKGKTFQKGIQLFESRFPKTAKIALDKLGLEEALNEGVKIAITFGILTNTTLHTDTALRDRIKATAWSTLIAAPLVAMGRISPFTWRTSAHATFGASMELLQSGSLDKAMVQSAIWGGIGAMGGVPKITGMSVEKQVKYANNFLKGIPEIKNDIAEINAMGTGKVLTRREIVPKVEPTVRPEAVKVEPKIPPAAVVLPKWEPLERIIPPEWRAGFTYMGKIGDISLYKHGITRHYLNIDSTGRTYRYAEKGKYVPIDKEKAIESVYEGIEELKGKEGMPATRETPYDKTYVEEKIKAVRAAGFDVARFEIEKPEEFLRWLKVSPPSKVAPEDISMGRDDMPLVMEGQPAFLNWKARLKAQSLLVDSQEKNSTREPWTDEQTRIYETKPYDWEKFSRARGYTEEEINNYRRFENLIKEGGKFGLNDIDVMSLMASEFPTHTGTWRPTDDITKLRETQNPPRVHEKIEKIKTIKSKLAPIKAKYLAPLNPDKIVNDIVKGREIKAVDLFSPEEIKDMNRAILKTEAEAVTTRTGVQGTELLENFNAQVAIDRTVKRVKVAGKEVELTAEEALGKRGMIPKTEEGQLVTPVKGLSAEEKMANDILSRFIASIQGKSDTIGEAILAAEQGKKTIAVESLKKLFNGYEKYPSFVNKVLNTIWDTPPGKLYEQLNKLTLPFEADMKSLQNLRDAISRFKTTDGSRGALADSINDAFGQKIPDISKKYTTANAILKEFGIDNVDQLYFDLWSKYPDVFDPVKRIEANVRVFEENALKDEYYDIETRPITREELPKINEAIKTRDIIEEGELAKPNRLTNYKTLEEKLMDSLDAAFLSARLPKGVLGKMSSDQVMKLKDKGFAVFAHEWSHGINAKYNLISNLKEGAGINPLYKSILRELIDNFPAEKRVAYPQKKWVEESFADTFSVWLRGGNIGEKMPLTMKYLEESISGQEPALWGTLLDARQQAIGIQNAPFHERTKAAMYENNEGSIIKRMYEAAQDRTFLQKTSDWIQDLYRGQLNLVSYSYDLDKFYDLKGLNSIGHRMRTLAQRVDGLADFIWFRGVPKDIKDVLNVTPSGDVRVVTRGLSEIFGDVPVEHRRDVGAYLIHKRLITAAEIDLAKGKEPILPQDYTLEGLRREVARVEEALPIASEIANEVKNFYSAVRKTYLQAGWIDEKTFNLLEMNPRFASMVREGGIYNNDFKFNENFNETILKKFVGSRRDDFVDPFISMLTEVHSLSRTVVRADIYTRLDTQADIKEHKFLGRAMPSVKPINVYIDEVISMIRKRGIYSESELQKFKDLAVENSDSFGQFWRPFNTGDENIKVIRIGGQNKYMRISKEISGAIDAQFEKSSLDFAMNLISKYTNLKRNLATTFSPGFLLKNPVRDMFDAYIQAEAGFIPVVDSIKGLIHFIRGNSGTRDAVYDNAMLYGLRNQSLIMEGANPMIDRLKMVEGKGGVFKMARRAFEFIRGWAQASEMMTRLGVLSKYDMTKPEEIWKGIIDAQEASYNWKQKGYSDSAVSQMNKVNAFFKANLIAFDKQVRTLTGKETSVRTIKRMSPIMTLSILQAYLMRDNREYWDLPAFRRMMSINIPLGKGFVAIPFTGSVYFMMAWAAPQLFAHWLWERDKETAGQLKDGLRQMLNNAMPFGFDVAMQAGEMKMDLPSGLAKLLPDVLKPLFEDWANRSIFTSKPLVPAYLKDLPEAEKILSSTPEAAITLSEAWNASLGRLGVKLSPIKMDNYLRNVLFGMYDFANGFINITAQRLGIDQNELRKELDITRVYPLAVFYHEAYEPNMAYSVQKATDRFLKFNKIHEAYRFKLKNDPASAQPYLEENLAAIREYGIAKRSHDSIIQQLSLYRIIQRRRDLAPEVKDKQLEKIKQSILEVADKTNQILDMYEYGLENRQ